MSVLVQDAMIALKEYCALQASLLAAFFENYPLTDQRLLLDCPRNETFAYDNSSWEFQRHGVGVIFC